MLSSTAEKWNRPALYQEQNPDKVVRCVLCPHHCLLQDGQRGICRTRINRQGVLYTLAYGNPCSLAVDPIEKKPLFHFHPGTSILSIATKGCNFRCLNCQNWDISQSLPEESIHNEVLPEEVVRQALLHQTKSIAFTYTEPTVFYEYVLDTAVAAHKMGLKTVLISNGYINEKPLLELCQYLDAANIDLKCFDEEIYHRLTGGRLQPVLDTLKTIRDQGLWLEITSLLVPGFSDGPERIQAMCDWLVANGFEDTPLHFSRYFPAFKLHHLPATSEQSLLQAKKIAEATGIKYVYIGNIPGLHGENTYCPHCRHLLVERSGYVVRQNALDSGCCAFCGTRIPGVWA
ncbi:MAG TPA: AmmeMemoRadiSam system radical SAM enzyme [Bacteroidales bacterium]